MSPGWRSDVLRQLDDAARETMFPGEPNRYYYLAAMRMIVFRSDAEWLLVFQAVGFETRLACFMNTVTSFGSGLDERGFMTVEVVTLPAYEESDSELDELDLDITRLEVDVRGRRRTLTASSDDLRAAGVDDESMPLPARVIRLVACKVRDELFLSDDELLELTGRSGSGLTPFLQLEDWRQPNTYNEELPSDIECFGSLATAVAAGDPSIYRCPETQWNTHWSRWED